MSTINGDAILNLSEENHHFHFWTSRPVKLTVLAKDQKIPVLVFCQDSILSERSKIAEGHELKNAYATADNKPCVLPKFPRIYYRTHLLLRSKIARS
jgi:hypothetical protein